MTTIVEFLRARLDEDEAVALYVDPSQSYRAMGAGLTHLGDHHATEHFRRHGPERVLREVEAKRAILRLHTVSAYSKGLHLCEDTLIDPEECPTLHALASAYADHPDHESKWNWHRDAP